MVDLTRCPNCGDERPIGSIYCRGHYCAKAVPEPTVLRAKLARFASRLDRADAHIASALGCLNEALDVVKGEKFAGLGQLEADASSAYDIAQAVARLISHGSSDVEDIRVAAVKARMAGKS